VNLVLYLIGELLYADALSEPRQRSVDELKHGPERYQVGGDVGYQRYSVGSASCRSLDDVDLCSANVTNIRTASALLRNTPLKCTVVPVAVG